MPKQKKKQPECATKRRKTLRKSHMTIDDFFEEILALRIVLTAEERHALLEEADQEILDHYGVKARQDIQ